MGVTRRALVGGVVAGAVGTHLFENTAIPTGEQFPAIPQNGSTILNDAGELSPTPVAKHIIIDTNDQKATVDRVRTEIREAKLAGRPLIAHEARHSMGGQSLARMGSAMTMQQTWVETDTSNKTYHVGGGTRWRDVILALDKVGYSPAVMQSNNDFGVASTYCVNAHGWPVAFSGGGTTVKSLKMMLASGDYITCSRKENAEIFSAAMGGYGLFGVITELELQMVPNANLLPTYEVMPAEEFGKKFVEVIRNDKNLIMAYGRLDMTISSFCREAMIITYRPATDQSNVPAASGSGFVSEVATKIFREQVGSDHWKKTRWNIESRLNPLISTGASSRNSLMNEPVATLASGDQTRTDILHEYFVDGDKFPEFVQACRDVIPSSFQQLLNVTLRFVDTDHDSVLAYAVSPRIAAVMLFSQEKTVRAEADMARMTTALIERVLAIGGTYYLPYRPHATLDQFQRGYRRFAEFSVLKRKLDPDLLFRNNLWDQYISKA